MAKLFSKAKKTLSEIKNGKSVYELFDVTTEQLQEIAENKNHLSVIQMEEIRPVYKTDGRLDYVQFTSAENGTKEVRVLRLFRIRSIASQIRTKMNNQKAFADILKEFSGGEVTFTKIDAYKAGEDLIFTYGVVMEGLEREIQRLVEKTDLYIHALRAQFKGAYDNIEICSLTREEHWMFAENFHFSELSWVRGIPQKDSSKGAKTGSDFYNAHPMAEEEAEVFYKGMIASDEDGAFEDTSFLLCSTFDLIDASTIEKLLDKMHNMISKLQSSVEQGLNESETIGLPIMMGLGIGDGFSTSEQNGTNTTEGTTITEGSTQGTSVGSGVAEQSGVANGRTEGQQIGTSETNTLSNSNNTSVGGRVMGIGADSGWGESEANGISKSEAYTAATNTQESTSTTTSTQEQTSQSTSISEGKTNTQGQTSVLGTQAMNTNSSTVAAGTSIGSNSGVGRRIVDAAMRTSLEKAELNLQRVTSALSIGMFEGRTVILTPNKRVKTKAEFLYKQAFLTEGTPFPIRIEQFNEKDERKIIRYAKMLRKTNEKERRVTLLEREKFSTFYTVEEMTAHNPIQTNMPGYTTSHEPIPKSIRIPGKMKKGAFLGYQLNSVLNERSSQPYYLSKESLTHIGVYGNTGMGKTTCVKRLTIELRNELDVNVLVFDWATDYRSVMDHLHNKADYFFHTFEPNFFGLRLNLIKPPKNVPHDIWSGVLAEIFCIAFGLGNRSLLIITELIRELLQQVPNPTMKDLAAKVDAEFEDRSQKAGKMMDFNEKSTFSSMKDRLQGWMGEKKDAKGNVVYDRTKTAMYKSLCEEGYFMEIEDLIKGDFYRVIECGGIPEGDRPFVVNAIAAAIAYYREYNRSMLAKPMYMVFEEAHEVLSQSTGNEPIAQNETIFEKMNRFTRKFGLYFLYSCQKPETIPKGIFDTTPTQITFQIPSIVSKEMFVSSGGRDEVRADKDLVNFLSRLPFGTAVIRQGKIQNIVDGEFAAVKIEKLLLDQENISNDFFKKIYNQIKRVR